MWTLLIIVICVTVLSSFTCSLIEAAIYSITSIQVEALKSRKAFGAQRLDLLRQSMEETIAALLTFNTVTNAYGPATCGMIMTKINGEAGAGIITGVLALLILFVGEAIPKNLGVAYATTVAPLAAWPLQCLIWIAWPIVKISGYIASYLTRHRPSNVVPTEDEIVILTRLAARGGQLRLQELHFIENVLGLDKIKAKDIMTPRTIVYSLPADLPLASVQQHSEHWLHSRLPVTEDRDPDRIIGMVHRREVFDAIVKSRQAKSLRDLMKAIDFVPDTMRAHDLLDKMIKEKKHMVAVVDEYGGFEGVVTLEDVLECLLGLEIVDEYDRHPDLQKLARLRAQRRQALLQSLRVDKDGAAPGSPVQPASDT